MNCLDDLNLFVAVAEAASFTAAAGRLGMPKSSVSRAVTRLEAALGNRLFERSTRHLRLTEAGEQLWTQSAPLLQRLENVLELSMAHNEAPRGLLKIASPYELGILRLGTVVNRVLAQHPALEAQVELTSRHHDPRAEDFDIVFRLQAAPLPDSGQIARRIYDVPRRLYASPALRDQLRLETLVHPGELATLPCLMSPAEPEWQLCAPDGQIVTIQPRGRLRAYNVSLLLQGVIAGLGIGLLSDSYCSEAVKRGEIVPLLPDYPPLPLRVYALLPGRRLMPAKVRVFLDAVAEELERGDPGSAAPHPVR
ncbi:LysR family transcriptional regulator [Microvirgula aerodenitrificans]|uniref:LysR family transcriptional regulator n=1 Tax=Microvirgula aerodenitrificans TaxID=57480 RepID=UPI0028EC25B0|nr:LysR family transcriptional regulator [Microvirgula aerodenitrificans]